MESKNKIANCATGACTRPQTLLHRRAAAAVVRICSSDSHTVWLKASFFFNESFTKHNKK